MSCSSVLVKEFTPIHPPDTETYRTRVRLGMGQQLQRDDHDADQDEHEHQPQGAPEAELAPAQREPGKECQRRHEHPLPPDQRRGRGEDPERAETQQDQRTDNGSTSSPRDFQLVAQLCACGQRRVDRRVGNQVGNQSCHQDRGHGHQQAHGRCPGFRVMAVQVHGQQHRERGEGHVDALLQPAGHLLGRGLVIASGFSVAFHGVLRYVG
ncbi:hypothetical protein AA310_17065 [Arthrobacter sp. YC-RL1]|nr:hypothetical protein AA310_17065 [Arthrobacter sp. YC-RL1]